jgi:radical SAM-linked protein
MTIHGKIAYISHLDLLAAVGRALRRAELPIAYSQGFNPHMLISWGFAHPVGMMSEGEYFDVDFVRPPDSNWLEKLNEVLPEGLLVAAAQPINAQTPALMAAIDTAVYRIKLKELHAAVIQKRIDELLAAKECLIERVSPKGRKVIDARPALLDLRLEDDYLILVSRMNMPASKPAEIIKYLDKEAVITEINRIAMYINSDQCPVSSGQKGPDWAGSERV